MLFYLKTVDM